MNITVRLFAMLKEQAGRSELAVNLEGGATVRDALPVVGEQAGIATLIERMPLGYAVNREYSDIDTRLRDGDELALIPPVSGGAQEATQIPVKVRVTEGELSADRLTQAVGDARAGAILVFHGVTREVDRLEYEAYEEMAAERIEAILREVAAKHELLAVAAEHRVGAVPLGEASVVIAVSAGHRAEAFAGGREAIDRIKAEAPIWKREVRSSAEGEATEWVAGTPIGKEAK